MTISILSGQWWMQQYENWVYRRVVKRLRKMRHCPRCHSRRVERDTRHSFNNHGWLYYVCVKGHEWSVDYGDNFGIL